jgi:hypothetical protein
VYKRQVLQFSRLAVVCVKFSKRSGPRQAGAGDFQDEGLMDWSRFGGDI